MRTVSSLSIAPVKALALQHPGEIELESFGVASNRRFYLVDEHGQLRNNKHHGPLMQVQPTYDYTRDWLSLRFPDGRKVEGTIDLGEHVETDFFGKRTVAGRLVDGPWDAALSAYVGAPLRLVQTEQPGGGFDAEPISLLGEASVDALSRQADHDGSLDARRFRMLVTFAGGQAHEEDTWVGQQVRIGDAIVRVVSPVARCAVTTKAPDTGRKDVDVLQAIIDYRGLDANGKINFGVYGEVVEPGRVRVGDPVEALAAT